VPFLIQILLADYTPPCIRLRLRAMVVGTTRAQTMRYATAPQMLGVLIPPLTSQTLSMVEENSLLSSITVKELTMSGLVVQGNTFSPIETFTMVAGLYWAYTTALLVLARWLEWALAPAAAR